MADCVHPWGKPCPSGWSSLYLGLVLSSRALRLVTRPLTRGPLSRFLAFSHPRAALVPQELRMVMRRRRQVTSFDFSTTGLAQRMTTGQDTERAFRSSTLRARAPATDSPHGPQENTPLNRRNSRITGDYRALTCLLATNKMRGVTPLGTTPLNRGHAAGDAISGSRGWA